MLETSKTMILDGIMNTLCFKREEVKINLTKFGQVKIKNGFELPEDTVMNNPERSISC